MNLDTFTYHNQFKSYNIDEWQGQQFIFLKSPLFTPENDYHCFVRGKNPNIHSANGIPYQELAGRIAIVTKVAPKKMLPEYNLWNVIFKMIDDGTYYSTVAIAGIVHDIALASDIEIARNLWQGQTLWSVQGRVHTYNEEVNSYPEVRFRRFRRVKVLDIIPGFHTHAPIRFVVEAEDSPVGYVDVHLSNTNISENLRKYANFEHEFMTTEPRVLYPWHTEMWEAIENRQTPLGMTPLQVQLSVGTPPRIQKSVNEMEDCERWDGYKTESIYFHFVNGKLDSFNRQV